MTFSLRNPRTSIAALALVALLAAIVPLVFLTPEADAGVAGVYNVTTAVDQADDPAGVALSLREAFIDASEGSGPQVINLVAGNTYLLTLCNSDDSGSGASSTYGDLDYNNENGAALTINGNGAIIQQTCFGKDASRVIDNDEGNMLTINNTTITGGVTDDGGGIYTNGPLILDNSTVTANRAYDEGGGIHADNTQVTVRNNSFITNNEADQGGGVRIEVIEIELAVASEQDNDSEVALADVAPVVSTLTVENSTISNNRSQDDGAGIYAHKTDVTVTDSTIDGNTAGVLVSDVEITELSPTAGDCAHVLDGDGTAGAFVWGGGIALDYGTLSVTDSSVSGNVSCTLGGRRIIKKTTSTQISGSNIDNNAAVSFGGGIAAEMSPINVINGSTVDNNRAGFDVEVFDLRDGAFAPTVDCDIFESAAGGGIASGMYEDYPSDVTITDSSVSNNVACGDGGGIAQAPWPTPVYDVAASIIEVFEVNLQNAVVDGNVALGHHCGREDSEFGLDLCGGNGGGVLGMVVNVAQSSVSNNVANQFGGGIASSGPVTVTQSAINENEAGILGGGIYTDPIIGEIGIGASSDVTPFAVAPVLVQNSTVSSNVAGFAGGGIAQFSFLPIFDVGSSAFEYDFGDVSVEFSTIYGNEATGENGGIFAGAAAVLGAADEVPSLGSNIVSLGTLVSTASVIANPIGSSNCELFTEGSVSGGYNFTDDDSCELDDETELDGSVDPLLGALSGGAHTPELNSPLVDAVPAGFSVSSTQSAAVACELYTDQIGTTRPQGPGCDVGAIERVFVPEVLDDIQFTG